MPDNDSLKKSDQIRLLERSRDYTDSGNFDGCFTYPNCGWDLVQQGLVTKDRKITIAGRAALWLLGKGSDPTSSKAVEVFTLSLSTKETEK
jgi:hypothetical protein